MARVNVRHSIGDLAGDMAAIPAKAAKDMRDVVSHGVKLGNDLAKDFAKQTSGRHAKKYPGTFSSKMNRPYLGAGVILFSGEYGPVARGQGLLAPILERGSRNNPPHFNLLRSADMVGPAMAGETQRAIDRWFW